MDLTEQVAEVVESIIDRRHAARKAPEVAKLAEVMKQLPGESRQTLLQVFRQLHLSGRFRSAANINKEPMLMRRR